MAGSEEKVGLFLFSPPPAAATAAPSHMVQLFPAGFTLSVTSLELEMTIKNQRRRSGPFSARSASQEITKHQALNNDVFE